MPEYICSHKKPKRRLEVVAATADDAREIAAVKWPDLPKDFILVERQSWQVERDIQRQNKKYHGRVIRKAVEVDG